ncbi:TetR/AcrR family transcriptional regulator [Umezawaea sp. NPDC059074]|uniref:TetR/AcrR family transcriptional regulator n=1 Tax=Umezawaea sp. NPDC059074 TaxID=3346716 RepID=UPI00367A4CD3
MTRKRRADAEENRRHVLDTARAAFAADGVDLPIREVARRAEVGVATVYRHFPSRQDLLATVLDEQVRRCADRLRAALADPDPRRALRDTIVWFGEGQVRDRGLTEALLAPRYADQRRAHAEAFAELVRRARSDGSVRPRVTVEDARVALMAIASFRGLPVDVATPAVRRLTDLLLTGVLHEETSRSEA